MGNLFRDPATYGTSNGVAAIDGSIKGTPSSCCFFSIFGRAASPGVSLGYAARGLPLLLPPFHYV